MAVLLTLPVGAFDAVVNHALINGPECQTVDQTNIDVLTHLAALERVLERQLCKAYHIQFRDEDSSMSHLMHDIEITLREEVPNYKNELTIPYINQIPNKPCMLSIKSCNIAIIKEAQNVQ